jgi:hypothetical protein
MNLIHCLLSFFFFLWDYVNKRFSYSLRRICVTLCDFRHNFPTTERCLPIYCSYVIPLTNFSTGPSFSLSRWPLTVEVWVRPKAIPYVICGGHKRHSDRFFCEYFSFSLSDSSHKCLIFIFEPFDTHLSLVFLLPHHTSAILPVQFYPINILIFINVKQSVYRPG